MSTASLQIRAAPCSVHDRLVGPDRPGQTPRALRGRAWRWVFAAHPLVMAAAVTATGNHYFLDSTAGVAVVLSALAAIRLFNPKDR